MNSHNFSRNSPLFKFIALCNDLSNNLLSNTTDDTWLSLLIIYIVLIVTLCSSFCNTVTSYSHANKAYVCCCSYLFILSSFAFLLLLWSLFFLFFSFLFFFNTFVLLFPSYQLFSTASRGFGIRAIRVIQDNDKHMFLWDVKEPTSLF